MALTATSPPIWFAPRSGDATPFYPDFSQLFTAPGQWQSHTAVFLVAAQWFRLNSVGAVQALIGGLRQAGIRLGVECGVLTPDATCGQGVEGFNASDLISAAQIVQQQGGTIDVVAMDEPFFFGTQTCQWSCWKLIKQSRATIHEFWTYFPNARVGDTEPIDSLSPWGRFECWAYAHAQATGRPLDFFRVDVHWDDPHWLPALQSYEAAVRKTGIPFAVIYNGTAADTSNSAWLNHAINNYQTYEGAGGKPDIVTIQSWNAFPDHLLPDSDPTALTSLVNTYAATHVVVA